MKTNIRDYPIIYWIIVLSLDVIFSVTTVLISFYSFYRERDKFFKDPNFHNEAFERNEMEKSNKKAEQEVKEKKVKAKSKVSKSLPDANKPNTQINVNDNPGNINNNDKINYINNKQQDLKTEISISQKKNLDEKKYTYQSYFNSYLSRNNNNIIAIEQPHNINENIIHIDSKSNLNTNPFYTNVKFQNNECNLVNDQNIDFAEDHKKIEKIESEMLRKYRRTIRCEFVCTIAVLIIATYSNIDTSINLKPRFLDTQFIIYNNSYLINEKNLVFNKTSVFVVEYLKEFQSDNNIENNKSRNIDGSSKKQSISKSTRENNNNNYKNTKYLKFLQNADVSDSLFLLNKYSNDFNLNNKQKAKQQIGESFIDNLRLLSSSLETELKDLKNISILQQNKNQFIYTNIEQKLNISLKQDFNISICKQYSESDLDKINFIYEFSSVRFSLLIINTIMNVFMLLLITIGFLYKVEINKLYKTKFVLILLILMDKCWSMSAVAFSYFDFKTNECLNAIDHFNVFFYTYLSYIFLFFWLILVIFIYSLFCRQMLYYILMILVSGLTLFIPVIFCLEKQQKCMEKIYIYQELHLKDDLEDMKNFRFKRQKQNFQLWMAYLVFLTIALTGISAFINFGILKYIWILNSWRTFAPAVGSITAIVAQFLQRCLY